MGGGPSRARVRAARRRRANGMPSRNDPGDLRAAGEAIDRVMREERAAADLLAQARREAEAIVEAARDEGRAIVNRATARISLWQAAHARAVDARVGKLRTEAARHERAKGAPDRAAIDAAVERVAARLTGHEPDDEYGRAR